MYVEIDLIKRGEISEPLVDVDLPPLKWSSLKYYFWMEDEIDGKEKAYG